jgi:hypothetical protein
VDKNENFKTTINMQEIEDKIEKLISESDNDELMAAWLEFLEKKREGAERLESRISKKDPVLIGAMIGALIGSIFEK